MQQQMQCLSFQMNITSYMRRSCFTSDDFMFIKPGSEHFSGSWPDRLLREANTGDSILVVFVGLSILRSSRSLYLAQLVLQKVFTVMRG